jgi:hypothetical protein
MGDQRTNRESHGGLKSAEEILRTLTRLIEGLHENPEMYIGSTTGPGAASTLDTAMWIPHRLWSDIQSRDGEFFDAIEVVVKRYDCRQRTYRDTYFAAHPGATEAEAFEFVRQCWRETAGLIGVFAPTSERENFNPTT